MSSDAIPEPPSPLPGFDYQPRTRLVFGVGAVEQVGALARELGASRVLLVTDPGLVMAGHAPRIERLLRDSGLETTTFAEVHENPTTADVGRCLEAARASQVNLFVAVGGGSAMDTAKGCNFLLTNGGCMADYWGVGKASKPMLPLIAIPTTAGTGSECQSAALIADDTSHRKMACLDPKAAARIAILDPALTLSLPPPVTAHTGIDAIAHAVETAVTTKRNALSLMFSHEALKLTIPSLERVLTHPEDIQARGHMLLGAALAGTAIENSMLGAAHAAANPLTAHFGVVHGEAVGIMLPAVVRFNAADEQAKRGYAELASAPEIACVSEGLDHAVNALVAELSRLLDAANVARSLADLGVTRSEVPKLAKEAARQWTASYNPRPVDVRDFETLYEEALRPRTK